MGIGYIRTVGVVEHLTMLITHTHIQTVGLAPAPEYVQTNLLDQKKILSVKLEKQDFINFLISVKLCAHTAVKSFPFISWNVKRKSKWFHFCDLKHVLPKSYEPVMHETKQ